MFPFAFTAGSLLLLLALVPAARAQISGQVRDFDTQTPIAGALVTVQATTTSTTTLPDGTFSLPGASGTDLVVVGATKGYYNEGTIASGGDSGVLIELRAVPDENFLEYQFVDPTGCGACHPDQLEQWTDSPMSQAGTNTWVYDIYDGSGTAGGMGGFVYTRDSAHAGTNPESECAACHQPEPWIMEPGRALMPVDSLSTEALHGISCDVCHKIAHIDETKTNFPGIHAEAVTYSRLSSDQVMYGVLGDTSISIPFVMRPSYQPQLVALACAACHQDKNDPDGNGDFEEANGVISEPTYGEWVDSPYGDPGSPQFATCVDCHMLPTGAVQVCDDDAPIRDPSTIRGHRIEGTTAQYLENAVTVDLTADLEDGELRADVAITNDQTGHHVPTGVTVRNMILVVEAWREEDGMPLAYTGSQLVHDLGGLGDPAQGYYAGQPGRYFSKVNHDSSGAGPTFFTDAAGITFDNRIPALATDVSSYSWELPPGGGTLKVRSRLIYRRAFRFLVDAKGWTEDGHGNPLEDVAPPYYGHLMEENELTIVATGVEEIAGLAATGLRQSRPNPARVSTEIAFRLGRNASACIEIFDLQGRRVATLLDADLSAGDHSVAWRGLSESGTPVAAGVYAYRLAVDGRTVDSRRLVWLK